MQPSTGSYYYQLNSESTEILWTAAVSKNPHGMERNILRRLGMIGPGKWGQEGEAMQSGYPISEFSAMSGKKGGEFRVFMDLPLTGELEASDMSEESVGAPKRSSTAPPNTWRK